MFYVVIFILCAFSATKGQEISGCPLYGCTPGGTFSLDSVITSADVEVAWTAQLENSTTAANVLLGCVSNENNIVCPTIKGYVSLDPKTGKELWRRDILLKPSLPIMDVNGDIIGSDGRSLVMIDGDGTTQPVIKLDVPVDSIYSLNLLDIGAFLIVSKTGEVIAYLINGIPLASLTLTGEVDGHDGIFHPMAQPVISGNRAYILTEFKPKAQNVSKKFACRLIAIDVNESITDRIAVVWFMELQDQSTLFHQPQSNANSPPPLSSNALKLIHKRTNLLLKFHPKITPRERNKLFVENNINKDKTGYFFISNLSSHYPDNKLGSGNNQSWLPSLLVQNHIVYLSLSATQITGDTNDASTSKMIAIKDSHNQGTVLFSDSKPLSYLASVRNQFKQGHIRTNIDSILIWSIGKFNGNILEGVDFMTGQVMARTNLSASFGEDVNITSQLMFSTTGYYRMFAIGVVRRMTNIMFVAWEFTFSTALCRPDDHRLHSKEIRRNASLVVTGNNILVSMAADPSSFVTCSSRDQSDMFWSIKDHGNSSELMYSMPLLVSTLSVYVDNQPKNRHHYSVGLGLVWTSPFSEPGEILGINLRNGTIAYKIPMSKYFGQNVSITTNIMVGQNTNGTILVFGVQNGTNARQNWVTGMQVTNGAVSTTTPLWKLQVPVTGTTGGQVINFHVGPDDGDGVRLAVLSTDSNRPTLITIKSK